MMDLPDDMLIEQEMQDVMWWLSYHSPRGCNRDCVAAAADENAERHTECLEEIFQRVFHPDEFEKRQMAVQDKEAVEKLKQIGSKGPWQDYWSDEAKNLIKERYWDEYDRRMDPDRFIIDRLRNEKRHETVLDCFEVSFESILHKLIAQCLIGKDCPLLFFVFAERKTQAFWTRKQEVRDTSAALRWDVDVLFEKMVKPRPFGTPSEKQGERGTEPSEQCPDGVLAEHEMLGMMRWVYLVGRDFEKAEIVEKAEMATKQAERGEEPDEESLEALRRLLRIRRGRFRPPATYEEHDSRARPLFGDSERPARPWAWGLREWIGVNKWAKRSKEFIESRYLSPDDADGVFGMCFIRDRLESEQGRGKLVNTYRTDFRVLKGRYEPAEELQALIGDQPETLWFEFQEVNGLAFGVYPKGFSIDAQEGIDDYFEKKGKRRPFGTVSEKDGHVAVRIDAKVNRQSQPPVLQIGCENGMPTVKFSGKEAEVFRAKEHAFSMLCFLASARKCDEGWVHKVNDLQCKAPKAQEFYELRSKVLGPLECKHLIQASGRRDFKVRLDLSADSIEIDETLTQFVSVHRDRTEEMMRRWKDVEEPDSQALKNLEDQAYQLGRNSKMVRQALQRLGWDLADDSWRGVVKRAFEFLESHFEHLETPAEVLEEFSDRPPRF